MKYKIIVDKQSRTNPSEEKREYEVDIEELRTRRNVYDSIVITRDEAYVLRKFILSDLMVLSELEEPIKEPLQDLNIELFEGDNYIYLIDMIGNKFYAEYLIKNEFNELYVTLNQMNSAINQTAENIELTVNQKLEGYSTTKEMNSAINQSAENIQLTVNQKLEDYSTTEEMNAIIEVTANVINSEVSKKVGEDEIISKINQSAEAITIDAEKININGTISANGNFKIDTEGNITANNGTFTGGKISLIGGTESNPNFYIDGDEFHAALTPEGLYINHDTNTSKHAYIYSDDIGGGITLGGNTGNDITLRGGSSPKIICYGEVQAQSHTYLSLEGKKKNITELNKNAISIVKDAKLYEFNYKTEEDTDKKHIGFVIGDKYNTPNEVIAKSGEGIDTYSMSSIMWKAIQELTARVEQLEKEVANGKN